MSFECCFGYASPSGIATGGGVGGGVAISAGTQLATSGTVIFSNANGVSFGMAGSASVTASVQAIKAVSAGTTNNSTLTGLSFANGSGVSFGLNGATVTASVASNTPGAISAGTSSFTLGTAVFANSNGVSFGASNGTVTASVAAQTGTQAAIGAGSVTTPAGTIIFSNGSGVSFGMAGSTVTASVAAETPFAISAGTQSVSTGTLVLSNSNGISFGMSGSSRVTANYASYVSMFGQNTDAQNTYAASINTLSLWPVTIPVYISATGVAFAVSMQLSSASTGAWSHSFGIYTLSGVSASLASSALGQFSFTSGSDTTASNIFAGASGLRYRTFTINANLTPGVYLFALHIQTSGGNSVSLSLAGGGAQAMIGSYQGFDTNMWLGGISNSSFTSAMPASIAANNTNYQRTAIGVRGPLFWLVGTT